MILPFKTRWAIRSAVEICCVREQYNVIIVLSTHKKVNGVVDHIKEILRPLISGIDNFQVKRTKDSALFIFPNGSSILVRAYNDTVRGQRTNWLLFDKDIPMQIYNLIAPIATDQYNIDGTIRYYGKSDLIEVYDE